MKQADYLAKGDTIRIISTARKISREELEAAIHLYESWGLKVELGQNLLREEHQFAGSELERLEDFQTALDDPNINAIFFARGGYGSVQIVDRVNWNAFTRKPKWLVGYSDVTVYHSHINKNFGIESLHAAMPVNIKADSSGLSSEGLESIRSALFGKQLSYEWENSGLNQNFEKRISGKLVGGNLSILYSLSGTSSQLEGVDNILFIEDLDEYLYHIDRMMMNLIRSSLAAKCKAILIGGMSDMNDNTIPFGKDAEEIIVHRMKELKTPLIFGFPAGHIHDNRSLILGRQVDISKNGAKVKIEFHERA